MPSDQKPKTVAELAAILATKDQRMKVEFVVVSTEGGLVCANVTATMAKSISKFLKVFM